VCGRRSQIHVGSLPRLHLLTPIDELVHGIAALGRKSALCREKPGIGIAYPLFHVSSHIVPFHESGIVLCATVSR
jgi:hypothetical protein